MAFKDHFSSQSAAYRRYRPEYPAELVRYVGSLAPDRRVAIDCATGNGQAAVALAEHFENRAGGRWQLEPARAGAGTSARPVRRGLSEQLPLRDCSVSLVAAAQAPTGSISIASMPSAAACWCRAAWSHSGPTRNSVSIREWMRSSTSFTPRWSARTGRRSGASWTRLIAPCRSRGTRIRATVRARNRLGAAAGPGLPRDLVGRATLQGPAGRGSAAGARAAAGGGVAERRGASTALADPPAYRSHLNPLYSGALGRPMERAERRHSNAHFEVAAIAVASLFLSACGYNTLQVQDEEVKSAWSEVVNQYQRRADLIPNLVATVKGFAAQEQAVLVGVTEARARATQVNVDANNPESLKQFQAAQGELSSALSRLMVSSSAIPSSSPTRISATCRRSSRAPRIASPWRAIATSRRCRTSTSRCAVPDEPDGDGVRLRREAEFHRRERSCHRSAADGGLLQRAGTRAVATGSGRTRARARRRVRVTHRRRGGPDMPLIASGRPWLRLLAALSCAAGAFFSSPAFTQALVAIPPLTAPVTDLAGALTPDQSAALDAKLRAFERAKGSQVAVLIVPTTSPRKSSSMRSASPRPGRSVAAASMTVRSCWSHCRIDGYGSRWVTDSRVHCPTQPRTGSSRKTSSRSSVAATSPAESPPASIGCCGSSRASRCQSRKRARRRRACRACSRCCRSCSFSRWQAARRCDACWTRRRRARHGRPARIPDLGAGRHPRVRHRRRHLRVHPGAARWSRWRWRRSRWQRLVQPAPRRRLGPSGRIWRRGGGFGGGWSGGGGGFGGGGASGRW